VEQQSYDIASAAICDNLINELSKCSVVQKSPLYCLFTKLRELCKEELFWGWKFAFNELKLSELLEVVEV